MSASHRSHGPTGPPVVIAAVAPHFAPSHIFINSRGAAAMTEGAVRKEMRSMAKITRTIFEFGK